MPVLHKVLHFSFVPPPSVCASRYDPSRNIRSPRDTLASMSGLKKPLQNCLESKLPIVHESMTTLVSELVSEHGVAVQLGETETQLWSRVSVLSDVLRDLHSTTGSCPCSVSAESFPRPAFIP